MHANREAGSRCCFSAVGRAVLFAFVCVSVSGCGAISRYQARNIARIFSEPPGADVFFKDDDPELIGQALPFALKTYEALLASEPANRDLLLTAAEGFVTYAHAFVYERAERLAEEDLEEAQSLKKRAGKLFLRGRDYAFSGLDVDHPAFELRLRRDPAQALKALSLEDVPLLYWAAAGWAGAVSADRSNMELLAELPLVEAMMKRALELDEAFGDGAVHEFFITYEGSRSPAMGGGTEDAQEHFTRALTLTKGKKASLYVALASSVAVREQDCKMFKDLLNKALAIDPDAVPRWRLSNVLAQDKAQWLLNNVPQFFWDCEETQL